MLQSLEDVDLARKVVRLVVRLGAVHARSAEAPPELVRLDHLDRVPFALLLMECLHDGCERTLAELVLQVVVLVQTSARGTTRDVPKDKACARLEEGREEERRRGALTVVLESSGRGLRRARPERELVPVAKNLALALADLLTIDLAGTQWAHSGTEAKPLTKVPLLERSVTLTADFAVSSPSHSIMQWKLPGARQRSGRETKTRDASRLTDLHAREDNVVLLVFAVATDAVDALHLEEVDTAQAGAAGN